MRKLSIKQDKFVREYAKHGNGALAARKAGYSAANGVDRSIAAENLTKPYISAELAKHRARLAERLDISREKLLNDAAHDAEQAALKGDYSASNAQRTFIAKVQGYVIDRAVNVNVDTSIAHLDALREIMQGRRQSSVEGRTRAPITDVDDEHERDD
jgi:hypothetical protein